MIAAVHTFNGAGLYFRAELFIVTAIIAWTYLHHAYFRRLGIDYRYYKNVDGVKQVSTLESGAERYWELGNCLKHAKCPLTKGMIANLEFLLELRHEIEHRSTSRIDDAVSAQLQACCINFNEVIKPLFGATVRPGTLAADCLGIRDQPDQLPEKAGGLPRNVETMMDGFEGRLTPEQQADPRYAFRCFTIGRTANRAPSADLAVEIVLPGSEVAEKFSIASKEVEKKKYLPSEVVNQIKAEGWDRLTMDSHTKLWKKLDARNWAGPLRRHRGRQDLVLGTSTWAEPGSGGVRAACKHISHRYGRPSRCRHSRGGISMTGYPKNSWVNS